MGLKCDIYKSAQAKEVFRESLVNGELQMAKLEEVRGIKMVKAPNGAVQFRKGKEIIMSCIEKRDEQK